MKSKLYFIIIVLVLIFIISGCKSEELQTLDQGYNDLKKEYKTLQEENKIIKEQNSSLQADKQKLEEKNKELMSEIKYIKEENTSLNQKVDEYSQLNGDLSYLNEIRLKNLLVRVEEIKLLREEILKCLNLLEKHEDIEVSSTILNMYDPYVIEVGDKIAGLTVTEVDFYNGEKFGISDQSIKFSGRFEVSGKFILSDENIAYFSVSEEYIERMPYQLEDKQNGYIYFFIKNTDDVLNALKEHFDEILYNKAIYMTVIFSEYTDVFKYESGYCSSAYFEEIISINE